MSYNLFLDDERQPWQVGNYIYPIGLKAVYRLKEWVIVKNYEQFVKVIEERGLPDLVSFDHDLADIHYDPLTQKDGETVDAEIRDILDTKSHGGFESLSLYTKPIA